MSGRVFLSMALAVLALVLLTAVLAFVTWAPVPFLWDWSPGQRVALIGVFAGVSVIIWVWLE